MSDRASSFARPCTGQKDVVSRITSFMLLLASFVFLAVLPGFAADGAPLLAFKARIAGDDARTRIVMEFDARPDFKLHYLDSPERVIVELPATAFGFPADDLKPRGVFKNIRFGAMDGQSARIVLTALRPVKVTLAEVQPSEDGKAFRLVLDAEVVKPDVFARLLKSQTWNSDGTDPGAGANATDRTNQPGTMPSDQAAKSGSFVVAIDAGHGGIDTGALGASTRTPEKEVTLSFARVLVEQLNRQQGIKAFLTRDADHFLSLSERVLITRQNHANLFISIHADTLKQKDIRGSTVYTISDRASDRMAADLAERENLSDEIAGVGKSSEPPAIADILFDLTKRETQAFSIAMARNVVSSFEGQVGLINNPHRSAGFMVLQAHDVPSILLELGFLSNEEDEKLLLDPQWRDKVATLLAKAVTRYRAQAFANGG